MATSQSLPVKKQISLSTRAKLKHPAGQYECVRFTVTPEMSESKSVSYVDVSDVRLPASILIYMGSPSRNYNINAKFLSRSVDEADQTYAYLNLLRGWCDGRVSGLDAGTKTLTNKGKTWATADQKETPAKTQPSKDQTQDNSKSQSLSNVPPTVTYSVGDNLFDSTTPEVLLLEGYGGQFKHIPTVIRSLNISFPADVTYTQTSTGVWMPVIHDVALQLQEAREVFAGKGSIGTFNLGKFKAGTLDFW
jgi:hypothetical protein